MHRSSTLDLRVLAHTAIERIAALLDSPVPAPFPPGTYVDADQCIRAILAHHMPVLNHMARFVYTTRPDIQLLVDDDARDPTWAIYGEQIELVDGAEDDERRLHHFRTYDEREPSAAGGGEPRMGDHLLHTRVLPVGSGRTPFGSVRIRRPFALAYVGQLGHVAALFVDKHARCATYFDSSFVDTDAQMFLESIPTAAVAATIRWRLGRDVDTVFGAGSHAQMAGTCLSSATMCIGVLATTLPAAMSATASTLLDLLSDGSVTHADFDNIVLEFTWRFLEMVDPARYHRADLEFGDAPQQLVVRVLYDGPLHTTVADAIAEFGDDQGGVAVDSDLQVARLHFLVPLSCTWGDLSTRVARILNMPLDSLVFATSDEDVSPPPDALLTDCGLDVYKGELDLTAFERAAAPAAYS